MKAELCTICEGEFNVVKLINGKCDVCNARFPDVKDKAELIEKQKAQANQKDISEFEKEVNKVLEKHGILQRCECGNLYHKRSPAQKSCGCQGKTDDKN